MKLTKQQLKQIIKEELNEISGKQKAHIARQKKQQEERAKKDAEAQELIQLIGKEWDVNVRMLEDRYQITVSKAFDSSYDEEEPSDEQKYVMAFSAILGISPEEATAIPPEEISAMAQQIRQAYQQKKMDAPPLNEPKGGWKDPFAGK